MSERLDDEVPPIRRRSSRPGIHVRNRAVPASERTKSPARMMTPGRRWRLRRDLVIATAHKAGISQRFLADVFDLPRSRIAAIIKAIHERAERGSA